MERECYKDLCKKYVGFICSFGSINLYSCKKHIVEFMYDNKDYEIIPILVDLPKDGAFKTLNKTQEILEFLTALRCKNYQITTQLIKKIMNQYRVFESRILNTINDIVKAKIRIKKNKGIDSDLYSWISDINTDFMRKTLLSVSKDYNIGNIFNNNILDIRENDCENMLFIRKRTKELRKIDLSSYKVTSPDFLKGKTIGSGFSLCRLKNDHFLYYGGYASLKRLGSTYLIDLKRNNCVELDAQDPSSGSGSILKDGIVYIFGGYTWNNNLITCKTFDIKKQKWTSIKDLPFGISSCTAALNLNKILITGYCTPYLYHYNEEEQFYIEIMKLPGEGYNYATENYIIYNDSLLVDEKYDFNYEYYPNPGFSIENISPYCFFRRKNFIYFIEHEGRLFRINCEGKKIEYVTCIN